MQTACLDALKSLFVYHRAFRRYFSDSLLEMTEYSQFVPGLDEVRFRTITYGDYEAICELIDKVEESHKALTFTKLVLGQLLVDSALQEMLTSLPEKSAEALVIIAANSLGYSEELASGEFEKVPIVERLYAVHCSAMSESQKQWEAMDKRMNELQAAYPKIYNALKEAGFWIPLSAPFRLAIYLEALVNKGVATPENVTAQIVERFRHDEFAALKSMVEDWCSIDYFHERKDIIKDAIDAHMTERYTLSIPALLPLAEGYYRSRVGVPKFSGVGRWIAEGLEKFDNQSSGIVRMDVGALSPYIRNDLFVDIPKSDQTPEKYRQWSREKGFRTLHRNAILHGLQSDYATEENSLRTFFLIASLAGLELNEN